MSTQKTFNYFAYGSNLLAKRIHIQNPSAVRKNIGELKVRNFHGIQYSYIFKFFIYVFRIIA